MQDIPNEVTSLNQYLQNLTLENAVKGRKAYCRSVNSIDGAYDAAPDLRKQLDFAPNENNISNIQTNGRYELFGNSTSPILPPPPQEIIEDGRHICSHNLLPRPATAGSVADYRRSPLAYANSLESCFSDTGLARPPKYDDECFLDKTYRYVDSMKPSPIWTDSLHPPGITSPTISNSPPLWDEGLADHCYLNHGGVGCWMPAVAKLCQHIQQNGTQRQFSRRFDCRSAVDLLKGTQNMNGVHRPLRSQRVDVRILYAMMYRALANGLTGGRREVCVFCRNNGEHELIYTSHSLKDSRNRVTCPILRAYQCPICLSTGDKAHTIKYCPYNSDSSVSQDTPLEKLFRYVHGQQQYLPPAAAAFPNGNGIGPPTNQLISGDSSVDVADMLVNLLQSDSMTTGGVTDSGSLLSASRLFR